MRVSRGQAFVRAWPAAHGEIAGRAALVGFMEVEGPVEDEVVHGMALLVGDDALMLTATGARHAPEHDHTDCDVDAILRSGSWPRPDPASGMDGGGLLLRRTRVPAAAGTLFMMIGLMSTDALADQTMVGVEGDLGGVLILSGTTCARALETNGSTLAQIMKRPMWGWEGDPWGIASCLHLDTIDECRRYEDLLAGAPEARPGELEALRRGRAGSVLHCGMTDPTYQRFKAEWLSRYGPARWDGVETAADQAETDRRARELVASIRKSEYA